MFLSFCLLACLPLSAFADDFTVDVLNNISEIYGIPVSILETLDQEYVEDLIYNIENNEGVKYKDIYVKITSSEDGEPVSTESTYQEYLDSMQSKAPKSDEWMKVHITIIEKDADCAQISAAFTWLTRPSFRMRDVMGLSIIHGTIVNGTAKGFYRYMLSNGYSNTTAYTSGFDIVGAGMYMM